MTSKKEYVGDSVYVSEGSWAGEVILTTENGLPNDPSNTIAMEIEALETALRIAKEWELENRIK